MPKRAALFLACLALSVSCRRFVEGQLLFRDMMVLRDQLAAQVHESHVNVNVIKHTTVVVTFVDSPIGGLSSEEKQKRADEVAAFVLKNCKHQVSEVRTFFFTKSSLDR